MFIRNLNQLFVSRKSYVTTLIILGLCVTFGILLPIIGYKNGFLFLGGIIYLVLLSFSLIKYEFGFYTSLTFGFLIFIIGRLSNDSFPIGLLVELPLWLGCIGFFINAKSNRQMSFAKSKNAITINMIIFVVYYFLQLANPYSLSFLGWLYTFRRIAMLGLIYFISLQLFNSFRNVVFFFNYWIVLAFIAGIYGCIQHWFGFFDFEYNWIISSPVRSQLYYMWGGIFRKFSLFSDPSAFGIGMATTFILTLVLFIHVKGMGKRFFLLLISIFLLFSVGYSGTRTAYFIIVSGISFYILLTITKRNTLIFAGITLMLFAFLLYAPIYNNITINRFRTTFEFSEDASMNVRNVNRQKIRPYIYSHPFGGGLSTSGGTGQKYTPGHALAGFATDSGYVRTAVEAGWIGLLMQCFFYFLLMKSGLNAYFRSQNKIIRFYLIAILTCLFSFIVAQYAQDASDPTPLCFLFYPCLAFIARVEYFDKPLIDN